MANLDFGSITVTPGIRVERTDLTIRGFQLENETDVVAVNAKRNYTNWLPSLIVRIEPSDEVIVRLAYTRSVGRPNYSDRSEEHTSELPSLMRIPYAVFCFKKKNTTTLYSQTN